MIKRPTLSELIESAEKVVNPDDWYRQSLLLDKFHGMSKTTLVEYCKEMETIPEFAEGILRPGHSTTFIHCHTFIWFLKWKEANRYRAKQVSPLDVLEGSS